MGITVIIIVPCVGVYQRRLNTKCHIKCNIYIMYIVLLLGM